MTPSLDLFATLATHGYGELHACRDEATGLRALIGLYSTRLGPAIGGTRIRAYPNDAAAVDDVLRLARAMAYKAALARLPHGGGKAVILAPEGAFDRTELLQRFGEFVDGLAGRYVTTEDSGTSPADIDVIRSRTRHVVGASGGSGDPSPFTALGVRRGIEAVAAGWLGRSDLEGLRVALQGVGHVGTHLARELAKAGAKLTLTDVDPARRRAVAEELGAESVAPEAIFDVECDVLSPNALGGALSEATIPRLRCRAVAGAANNQLADPAVGRALHARKIFYAPDYAINAGGLINVAIEYAGYSAGRAQRQTLAVHDTILEILERSRREDTPPGEVADRLAERIMRDGLG
ncbi:MAG: Glu/Leu/Phe/Val dehydrogenase [Myxococcales bacterium]|nr:Glu/Leu/Phe/Val dehydrogenase [Myxococcales bacterium]